MYGKFITRTEFHMTLTFDKLSGTIKNIVTTQLIIQLKNNTKIIPVKQLVVQVPNLKNLQDHKNQ